MVNTAMKLRFLLLERKTMTNLDSVLKSRENTLPTKVNIVQSFDVRVGLQRGWEPKN